MARQLAQVESPERAVLEGVERISYSPVEGRVEMTPFPSSLRSCMAFLGEDLKYEYLMGVSGAAFRLLWNPGKWEGGNVDVLVMEADPLAPLRHALEAAGYAYEIVGNKDCDAEFTEMLELFDCHEDGEYLRRRIVESIASHHRPVLAFGVIGPPECCIITGYDDHGKTVIGWNYFQEMPEFASDAEFEPSGYFRRGEWAANTLGVILIGDKREVPERSYLERKAIEWTLTVTLT